MKRTIVVGGVVLILASAPLLSFLQRWEGGKNRSGGSVVYADKLARGLPTVCAGITKHATKEPIIVGDYWSELKCEQIEKLVIEQGQIELAKCIKRPITQGTFDALTSMGHNVGNGNVCASRALGLINKGYVAEGCRAISQDPKGNPVWSYVTDKDGRHVFVQGLYNRRLAETQLCMKNLT